MTPNESSLLPRQFHMELAQARTLAQAEDFELLEDTCKALEEALTDGASLALLQRFLNTVYSACAYYSLPPPARDSLPREIVLMSDLCATLLAILQEVKTGVGLGASPCG